MTSEPSSIPELSLTEAWKMLSEQSAAVLIDVRTRAEWTFVGLPDIGSLNKDVRTVEWTTFPDGAANPSFLAEATERLEAVQPLLLLCRSGARSLAAARALREAGFADVYNVVAGFEGQLDEAGHRHGGWKDELPWRQS